MFRRELFESDMRDTRGPPDLAKICVSGHQRAVHSPGGQSTSRTNHAQGVGPESRKTDAQRLETGDSN